PTSSPARFSPSDSIKVAFGCRVASTDDAGDGPCTAPPCETVTGSVRALPPPSRNATVRGTGTVAVLISVMVLVQEPPAAMWERTPVRALGSCARPILLYSANHTAPSGPTVMEKGVVPPGRTYSVNAPA